jgi:hypothetical protein
LKRRTDEHQRIAIRKCTVALRGDFNALPERILLRFMDNSGLGINRNITKEN